MAQSPHFRNNKALSGNYLGYPTQSPSTIAKGHDSMHQPPVGRGTKPQHNIGAALMGLFPSSGPQNKMKHENPIPSHNIPKTKLTQHSDQPGREKPPASWKAKPSGRG